MHIHRHWALLSCLSAFAIAALVTSAAAQVTSAQQSAIKANCRSDFMSKCSGVTPGGKDALTCLQKNVESLSSGCKSAVSATLPPPAPVAAPAPAKPAETAPAAAPQPASTPAVPAPVPAAPPKAAIAAPPKAVTPAAPAAPTAAQQNAMKQACRSDFMAKCSGVTPGGKEALACLQRNVGTLSPSCKQVVSTTMGAPAPTAAATAAPAAAVATAPAAGPTPQQLSAVKFTCRSDFRRYCKGVQAGGQEALVCLQRNAARLTPDCKTSLADIADSVPASAATPTAATAAAPAAAAPRPLPPGITPAGRVLRRVIERNR
jgi:hypothetical protein